MHGNGFDLQKKIQAASVLVRLEGMRCDRLRLLKLLYLADREAIQERSVPIVGGRTAALDNGPLHCEVYDLIKGESVESAEWAIHFSNSGHSVILTNEPELLDLSEYETEKLAEVFERYREVDTWSLVELTHDLPEWKHFHKPGSSQVIPMESILDAVGYTAEQIDEIVSENESHERLISKRYCAN